MRQFSDVSSIRLDSERNLFLHGPAKARAVAAADDADVLIIGAGPTGLTLAIELARHGVRIRLVDKRAGPVMRGQSCMVYPRTLELLDMLGCHGAWHKHSHPLKELSLHAFGQHAETLDLSDAGRVPVCVSQDATERMLVDYLGRLGVEVERLVEAVAVTPDDAGDDAGVRTSLRMPGGWIENVHTGWVVGCEGLDSLVRVTHEAPVEGRQTTGFIYCQAEAQLRWGYRSGIGHIFLEHNRLISFFPLNADGFYRVQCAQPYSPSVERADPTLEHMQALVREVADPYATLSDPLWLNRAYSENHVAQSFRTGRMFLAGNAARAHAPTEGAGLNAGMQDAFNLGWKLAYVIKGWAKPQLLDTYDAERRPAAERLVHLGGRSRQIFTASGGSMQATLRRIGATSALSSIRQLLREVTDDTDGIRQDGLLWEDRAGDGVRTGERAPDASLVLADGRMQCRLHEHLRGQRWTLLSFEGMISGAGARGSGSGALTKQVAAAFGRQVTLVRIVSGPEAANRHGWGGSVLLDLDGAVHRCYGAGQEAMLVLVRPDLRVGFRDYAYAGAQGLLDYLGRWLTLEQTA